MAWMTEQAYPIFLDVVLCVNLTTILFIFYFILFNLNKNSALTVNSIILKKEKCLLATVHHISNCLNL